MMITISKENYLKAIAEAEAEGKTVIPALLAHWLSVTPPAVTAALKRLRRDGLVTLERDSIQLTCRRTEGRGANHSSPSPDRAHALRDFRHGMG